MTWRPTGLMDFRHRANHEVAIDHQDAFCHFIMSCDWNDTKCRCPRGCACWQARPCGGYLALAAVLP